ncbi:hypothetical protein [Helicobacter burdigaliensis]|uniref:hypothetical protein n=1 Tax=Helicobacter burdigaliensis TaxID=2315334 RepID=UPI000EF720FF|nr:hypothetical protein [Helicobacter burdigaliensis]
MAILELKETTKITEVQKMRLAEECIIKNIHENAKALIYQLNCEDFAYELASNERTCVIYSNNPLVKIHYQSRFSFPSITGLKHRLKNIELVNFTPNATILEYLNPKTYSEFLSFRLYLEDAPKDIINLWIKSILGEILENIPKMMHNKEPYCIDVKEQILEYYQNIYQNINPIRLLILHSFIPHFIEDTAQIEESLGGAKTTLVYYNPLFWQTQKFYSYNLLKIWFFGVSKENLAQIAPPSKELWIAQSKKDFAIINKNLENRGLLYIESSQMQELEEFLKLALFYNYTLEGNYTTQEKTQIILLRKP